MVVLNRRKNETNYQSDEHGIKFKITSRKNTKQFEPYMEKMQDAITVQVLVKILVILCLDLDKFNVVAT